MSGVWVRRWPRPLQQLYYVRDFRPFRVRGRMTQSTRQHVLHRTALGVILTYVEGGRRAPTAAKVFARKDQRDAPHRAHSLANDVGDARGRPDKIQRFVGDMPKRPPPTALPWLRLRTP